jgi:Protein tyrosine/serine phosphatase
MQINKIPLETLQNTRDLGGLPTSDGKSIKPNRLIRSGRLYNISQSDKETLLRTHNVRTIIDFRIPSEIAEAPDDALDGVKYITIPAAEKETLGLTAPDGKMATFTDLMRAMETDDTFSPEEFMMSIYKGIITSAYSRSQYAKFIRELLDADDGATLWHCSAGKDRVGIGTAFLLSVLGAERDIIVEDFMMTNEFRKDETDWALEMMEKNGTASEKVRNMTYAMRRVEECYINAVFDIIDEDFGGMGEFIRNELHVSDVDRDTLKSMYLE